MIDLVAFHQNLLGITPEKTPTAFRLTKAQERLYKASNGSTKHGYLLCSGKGLQSWEHFLATFILAYGQTPEGTVAFAVSAPTQKWANEQVKTIARHIFSSRSRGKSSIGELFSKFQRLAMGSNVLQLAEPKRWVAYGFTETDVLPPWMRNRLINAGQS